MTSPYSIYIPIGVTYKDYKAEYFAAYIDSGSGCCVSKPQCFPEKYHQDLPIIRGRDISNQLIEIKRGIENPIILLGQYLIKCPPFYFHTTGCDILLGNNFLQLFHKITFDTLTSQILFKTPCHHLITVKRLKTAYAKPFPINFITRTAQCGDIGYKEKPIFSKGNPLIKFQLQLKTLDMDIEGIKNRLKQCFTENPLEFWNKNQIMAKLEMIDKHKVIREKPMRYNPEDKKEFNQQINELLKLEIYYQVGLKLKD
ncbi:hypothetical protein ACOSQ2_027095 [Xanthoceras sorbifolium]